jgi:hypothetical protein
MQQNNLPPNLYLKTYVVTSTNRYEVSADSHICMTANRDGKFYVSIMDRLTTQWTPRLDETQQWFPNRLMAEAWVATMHKKERKIVELRASAGADAEVAEARIAGSGMDNGGKP